MFFYSLVAFLILAPLFKAGNRPLPLLLLEIAATGFLLVILAVHRAPLSLPRTMWVAIAILLTYPLLQIVPIPLSLWEMLPGHATYVEVVNRFAAGEVLGQWRAISVIPGRSEAGWLAMLPALACLFAAMRLSPARVARLLLILAIFAGLESVLGLLQIGAGGDSILYLGNNSAYGAAIGTFVNRNHLAALLAMILPVMVGLLVFGMRPGRRHRKQSTKSEVFAQRAILFASAVLVLLCLLFTRSRAGMATAFVGLVCSAIVMVRARAVNEGMVRTKLATGLVLAMVAIAVVFAIIIGIAPILERFESGNTRDLGQGRLEMYAATLRAAMEFLPFGSGLSTFSDVFPRFATGYGFGGFVDYTHNDYLQAFMELGLAAPIVIALLLVAYCWRMVELLWREGGRSFTLLQLAAGVGMLPMILHSLFDFALHMPANAMWFATLAGVVFHRGVESTDPVVGELRKPPHLKTSGADPRTELLLPS